MTRSRRDGTTGTMAAMSAKSPGTATSAKVSSKNKTAFLKAEIHLRNFEPRRQTLTAFAPLPRLRGFFVYGSVAECGHSITLAVTVRS